MKKVIRLSESDLQRIIERIINENISLDSANNYYNTRTLQILKYPEKIPTISGYDQKIVDVVSKGIYDVVNGIGMGSESKAKLTYLISKGFTTLPNSIEICKRYKKLTEESLFDALDGEWMAGNSLETIKMMMAKSMSNYCNTSKTASICKIKSAEELKYGI
jgi:hypothetical protein